MAIDQWQMILDLREENKALRAKLDCARKCLVGVARVTNFGPYIETRFDDLNKYVRAMLDETAGQLLDTTPLKHVYHDREDGLQHCKVCNGGEGSLPTECPGYKMTSSAEDDVYSGKLDFKGGQWIAKTEKSTEATFQG